MNRLCKLVLNIKMLHSNLDTKNCLGPAKIVCYNRNGSIVTNDTTIFFFIRYNRDRYNRV
jgi:hypothetical protein